jgi:hypothetical protein
MQGIYGKFIIQIRGIRKRITWDKEVYGVT